MYFEICFVPLYISTLLDYLKRKIKENRRRNKVEKKKWKYLRSIIVGDIAQRSLDPWISEKPEMLSTKDSLSNGKVEKSVLSSRQLRTGND